MRITYVWRPLYDFDAIVYERNENFAGRYTQARRLCRYEEVDGSQRVNPLRDSTQSGFVRKTAQVENY